MVWYPRISAWLFGAAALVSAVQAQAQQTPRISWQSILNTPVFESGLMRFADVDIAFAPKQPGPVTLYVKNAKSEQLAKFGFYDTYRGQKAVFSRQAIENSSEYTFTPGVYALQYAVGGKAATQFVFKVDEFEVSDDPFNPQTTYRFLGPWQQYAYLMFPEKRDFKTGEDIPSVQLHFWAGQQDKPSTVKKGNLFARILKDGKMIAQSKLTLGYLGNRWLEQNKFDFYHPHERGKEVNAKAFYKQDMVAEDGEYQFAVNRMEDKQIIRGYTVTVKDGKLQPLPEAALDYEKGHQIVLPRVQPRGKQIYDLEPAFWIKRPQAK
jgi:hypothetical protein